MRQATLTQPWLNVTLSEKDNKRKRMQVFSRREAARLVAGGFFAAAAGRLPALASTAPEITEVAPGLFVRVGLHEQATAANKNAICNIGFVVGRESVAVIDTGGSLADGLAFREAIRARTSLPIRYVIVTHIHPDHILGSAAFTQDHPEFIGHATLPQFISERGEFYRKGMHDLLGEQGGAAIVPDRTVSSTATIDLGGRQLEIQARGRGHSGSDLTIMDPSTSTLWAADLLFVTRVPSLDGSLRGWLKELAELKQVKAARAVPGHGPASVPWPDAAADEERYLQTLAADVRAVLKRGGDIEEAMKVAAQSERGRWLLFDDYNAHNAAQAVHELEWENAE
jgi:quinoprotein relay system zinc metallohydrolase 2